MTVSLHIAVELYECQDCWREEGKQVTALVRLIPRAAIMDDKMVGTEAWCCTRCFRPKFDLKKKPWKTGPATAS